MEKNNKGYWVLLVVIISLGIVSIPDLFELDYWYKSLVKGTMLLLLPGIWMVYKKREDGFL